MKQKLIFIDLFFLVLQLWIMLICPEQQEEKLTKMDLNLFLDKQMAENNGEKVTVASKFRWCPGFG